MKLFTTQQVKRYFNILDRLGRSCNSLYKGYDKLNPNSEPCQREVYVKRTIGKWLKNKLLVLYVESEQTGVEYRQYVSVRSISYALHYKTELDISLFDYSRPADVWNSIIIDHNKALALEGEWIEDSTIHNQILKFSVLDIPEKEYVFEAYDWSKCPKRKKKGQTNEDVFESLKTTISFTTTTEKKAYKLMNKYRNSEIENKLIINELIEVSDI